MIVEFATLSSNVASAGGTMMPAGPQGKQGTQGEQGNAGPIGPDGPRGSTGPVPFYSPVEWGPGLICVVGPPATAVFYQGSLYICTTGHTSGATFDPTKWQQWFGAVTAAMVGEPNGVATLDANGLVPLSELPPAIVGSLQFQGVWNAATNAPALTSGTGAKGNYYVVSVAGSTTLDGISTWDVGDWAVFNGAVWQRISGGEGPATIPEGGTGATTASGALTNLGAAPLASPTFTGIPAAPTAAPGTNTTQIATTAFVDEAVAASGVSTLNGLNGNLTIQGNSALSVALAGSTILISPILRGHIAGLTLANDATSPNTVLDIAAGMATSDDNTTLMSLSSAITKSTAAWSVGSGNGGLDTGAIAANAWYHVHLIERTDTGIVDVLFSFSPNSPTMPANYTKKRRIGSIKTNSSAQIISFVQIGDWFQWTSNPNELNSVTPPASQTNLTLGGVPPGVQVIAVICGSYAGANVGNNVTFASPWQNVSSAGYQQLICQAAGVFIVAIMNVATDTSARITYKSSVNSGSLFLSTVGYFDTRGRWN